MIIPSVLLFIIGAMIGSFLSVVIYRIHEKKKGIFFGKSECPNCNKKLKARDLIPILSYILNSGKCRYCKKPIEKTYLFLEIVTGLFLVVTFLYYPFIEILINGSITFNFIEGNLFLFIYYGIISLFLIGIFFYDFKYLEIPEIFTYPAILIIFIVTFFIKEPGLIEMLIGASIAGIFFGTQVIVSKEKWLGIGDLQVGILMGMLLGWKLFLIALIVSYIIGTGISIVLLVSNKINRKSKIPFAPFLVTGTFITLYFGQNILDLYLSTLL